MADQGSEGLLSPFLRRQRLRAARPYLNGRILDFGCGSGLLAAFVPAAVYTGVDRDLPSLERARLDFPDHEFYSDLTNNLGKFDTIVALAVIEHVKDPCGFLRFLVGFLSNSSDARIVLTTPHPSMEWIHGVGAKLGFFSRHANEEHQKLIDYKSLNKIADNVGLKIYKYSRFLLWANQTAILLKK